MAGGQGFARGGAVPRGAAWGRVGGSVRARVPPDPPPMPAAPPAQLGKYRPLKKLGAGGMGVVYLAKDTALGRTVALKTLPKRPDTPPNLVARFRSEARAAAKLHHPGIVTVYDNGETDDALFIALEYIDGKDVDQLLRTRDRLPPKRSADLVRQIAEALDHLHEKGVVHRDIKPSNIMVRRDGSAVLTDLGLARAVEEEGEGNITRAGYTVGTVDYMSPEQAKSSRTADVRSDLYSLACTWFHMLTGRIPYPGDSLTAKLSAHAKDPVPDPRQEYSDIPDSFSAVLMRAMAKDPGDRHQTPAEFLEDLKQAMRRRGNVSSDLLRDLAEEDDDEEEIAALLAAEGARTGGRGAAADTAEIEDDAPGRRRRSRGTAAPGSGDPAPGTAAARRRRGKSKAAGAAGGRAGDGELPAADDSDPATPARGRRRGAAAKTKAGKAGAGRAATADGAQPKVKKAGGAGVDPVLVRNLAVAGLVVGVLAGCGYAIFKFAESLGPDASVIARRPRDVEEDRPAAAAGDDEEEDRVAATVVRDAETPEAAPETDPAAPPAWVADLAEPRASVRFAVAAGVGAVPEPPAGATAAGTLAEALAALPERGGTVVLTGPGPFALPPAALPEGAAVAIAAADPAAGPVVVLVSSGNEDAAPPTGWLRARGGSLTLENLHLVIPAALAGDGGFVPAAVDAVGATVAVRGGSVTAAGDDPAVAVRAAPGPGAGDAGRRSRGPAAGRVLIENAVLRGAALTGVSLPAGPAEAFAADSLFAGGAGPAVAFGGGAGPANAGGERNAAGGAFRFASLRTAQAGRSVRLVRCAGAFADAAVAFAPGVRGEVAVNVVETVLAAAPGADARLAANPGGAEANWAFADSLLAGLETPAGAAFTVERAENGWPGEPAAFADLDPARFRRSGLLRSASGAAPRWSAPGANAVARAAASAALPAPPADWDDLFPNGQRLETTPGDAAGLLARTHPNGTTIVIRGAGRVTFDPLTVAGRSLRILGEPGETDGAADPPVLTPSPGLGGSAALTAVGGRLELDNLALDARVDRTGAGPLVLADGAGAAVVVRRCRLEAVEEAPAVAVRGGGAAFLDRSLLVGPAGLVEVAGGLRAGRCAFVTPGGVLDLSAGAVAGLRRCTVSAGGPVFAGAGTVLTDACLFATPPPRSPGETVLAAGPTLWGSADALAVTVKPPPPGTPGELRGAETGPAAAVLTRPRAPAWNRVVPADLLPQPGSVAARGDLGAGAEVGPVAAAGAGRRPTGNTGPRRSGPGPNF